MGETATNSESKMCKKYFSSKDKLVINEDSNFCEMFHHFQMIFPCSEKCWTRQCQFAREILYSIHIRFPVSTSQETFSKESTYSSTESKFCTAVPSNMIHVIEILQEDLTHPKIFVPLQKAIEDCSIDEQRNFFIALREAEEYQSNENEINSL
ncbi:hypothetical protein SNEBB_007531 [Seison nebaliae]|nr:hypothetical protein SNEBB_007531 [Seison nebaliae]